MKNERYLVKTEFYIWAESDEEAVLMAKQYARKQRDKKDNRCLVVEVNKASFGSLLMSNIYKK